jgi:hypothetical protein
MAPNRNTSQRGSGAVVVDVRGLPPNSGSGSRVDQEAKRAGQGYTSDGRRVTVAWARVVLGNTDALRDLHSRGSGDACGVTAPGLEHGSPAMSRNPDITIEPKGRAFG